MQSRQTLIVAPSGMTGVNLPPVGPSLRYGPTGDPLPHGAANAPRRTLAWFHIGVEKMTNCYDVQIMRGRGDNASEEIRRVVGRHQAIEIARAEIDTDKLVRFVEVWTVIETDDGFKDLRVYSETQWQ